MMPKGEWWAALASMSVPACFPSRILCACAARRPAGRSACVAVRLLVQAPSVVAFAGGVVKAMVLSSRGMSGCLQKVCFSQPISLLEHGSLVERSAGAVVQVLREAAGVFSLHSHSGDPLQSLGFEQGLSYVIRVVLVNTPSRTCVQ